MIRHDDRVSLKQMLDHACEARDLSQGRSRTDLAADRTLQLALTRLVEVIGEAANRVSESTRERHPQIPWLEIIGMRNRLIHGYDVVDLNLLWDTIEIDLPKLIQQIKRVLQELGDG